MAGEQSQEVGVGGGVSWVPVERKLEAAADGLFRGTWKDWVSRAIFKPTVRAFPSSQARKLKKLPDSLSVGNS